MDEGKRLAELSRAIRLSSLKRLRGVPPGFETWQLSPGAMSFADLAHHLAQADRWLFAKLENPELAAMKGQAGEASIEGRDGFDALLGDLDTTGQERAAMLEELGDDDLDRLIPDDRFSGAVTVWWVIVRGNLDHEIHHRGQIAAYLRFLQSG